ncbi:MAG TPA: SAM-dependent methyltransferase [Vicinamibacterales bacterium]|nr:SAM-dependent methyltransferase [Vicinamibacterales bacterium]
MAEIRNVSGTAFVVAEFRAEESREASPLYQDPIVELFLSDDSRRAAGRVAASCPLVPDLVKIRTRYFDDTLDKHIRSEVRQVVILGAGLDTRAVRKRAPGVTFFEIDDPATLKLKETRYAQSGIEAGVRFIPGNYVTDGLIELLSRTDFDFNLPTYFIWEGNTMYLPLDTVKQILEDLTTHVTRFRMSFDYMAEAVVAKTTGNPGITRLVESFASMGAPWLSGIRDIQSLARELRLTLVENFKTSDLYRAYRRRPITSEIFAFYSVCTVSC